METIKTVWMNVFTFQIVIRWDEFDYEMNEMVTVYENSNSNENYLVHYLWPESQGGEFAEAFIQTHFFLGEF